MQRFGFDQYKVLAAAERMPSFTVRDLSAVAVVSEVYIYKILQRNREFFEQVANVSRGRGRPAMRYRVRRENQGRLRERLDQARSEMRVSIGLPETVDAAAVIPAPAALVSAENELLRVFDQVQSHEDKRAAVERARSLLSAERNAASDATDEWTERLKLAERLLEFREFELRFSATDRFSGSVARKVMLFLPHLLQTSAVLPEWLQEEIRGCLQRSTVVQKLSKSVAPVASPDVTATSSDEVFALEAPAERQLAR